MKIEQKAAWAERLRADDAWKWVISEMRDEAISQFTSSGAKDTERREEAHTLLRAITKMEGLLDAVIAERDHLNKKGQHRAND